MTKDRGGIESMPQSNGRKRQTIQLLTLLTLAAALTGCGLGKTLQAGTAYKAKILGSAVFISGRAEQSVLDVDLAFGPLPRIKANLDRENGSVSSRIFGMARNKVIFRAGLGCTLVKDFTEEEIRSQPLYAYRPARNIAALPWPTGDAMKPAKQFKGVDMARLDAALDDVFSEPADEDAGMRGTRAVVVVHRGRIIAERYAEGFDANMSLVGWSMTKSVTHALTGILVKQGKLDINAPAPVPEWQDEGDPRGAITLDMLLRMSSGLKFSEIYDEYTSDVVQMLNNCGDAGGFAADRPLEHDPDTHWQYSSGTANIVSRILRSTFEGNQGSYFLFPRSELFGKIGMRGAVLEPDASGTFVGSSYMYATARDWARFGLLYLNDGVWEGERLLPEGWVKYGTTPTPDAPKGRYGAHWWLNAGEPGNAENRAWPDLPTDAYAAQGFEGQRVMVIPSRNVVIVRLGLSRPERNFSTNDFAAAVLAAIDRPITR